MPQVVTLPKILSTPFLEDGVYHMVRAVGIPRLVAKVYDAYSLQCRDGYNGLQCREFMADVSPNNNLTGRTSSKKT